MSIFEFATVAVSLILGLAVACLLQSAVGAFQARRRCRLDWLPFLWAALILLHQFQFWWALYELNAAPALSLWTFMVLLYLSGLLFVAAALIFPDPGSDYPDDLGRYFAADGSWGAGAVAVYNLSAVGANAVIFHAPVMDAANLANLVLACLAGFVALTRVRKLHTAATLVYAVLFLFGAMSASSTSYDSTATVREVTDYLAGDNAGGADVRARTRWSMPG